jgi:hypothetical protein
VGCHFLASLRTGILTLAMMGHASALSSNVSKSLASGPDPGMGVPFHRLPDRV